mgnify:CR=1 FL=1
MSKSISLKEFMQVIGYIKLRAENCIKNHLEKYYIKKAEYINKTYGIDLKQALQMFYYAEYILNITVSFNIYGVNNRYYIKKPSIFRRIFRKYSVLYIQLLCDKIFINNRQIDNVEADNIKIIFN